MLSVDEILKKLSSMITWKVDQERTDSVALGKVAEKSRNVSACPLLFVVFSQVLEKNR